MALIILEGLDRTGKSSVAAMFQSKGYEIIHLSAPSKKYKEPGYTGPSYLDDMIDLIQSAALKDVVLDRSHYGEIIWPVVYGREPALSEDDIEVLREIEESVGVRRILMQDKDAEKHWQRCVDNKEPLTRTQFLKARVLYDRMANKYAFEKHVLTEFPEYLEYKEKSGAVEQSAAVEQVHLPAEQHVSTPQQTTGESSHRPSGTVSGAPTISREQAKLEQANAINDVLSKRIIKGKGPPYDNIENEVRTFLNKKLGTILGNDDPESLSKEDIFVLKSLVKRLKEKESNQ